MSTKKRLKNSTRGRHRGEPQRSVSERPGVPKLGPFVIHVEPSHEETLKSLHRHIDRAKTRLQELGRDPDCARVIELHFMKAGDRPLGIGFGPRLGAYEEAIRLLGDLKRGVDPEPWILAEIICMAEAALSETDPARYLCLFSEINYHWQYPAFRDLHEFQEAHKERTERCGRVGRKNKGRPGALTEILLIAYRLAIEKMKKRGDSQTELPIWRNAVWQLEHGNIKGADGVEETQLNTDQPIEVDDEREEITCHIFNSKGEGKRKVASFGRIRAILTGFRKPPAVAHQGNPTKARGRSLPQA